MEDFHGGHHFVSQAARRGEGLRPLHRGRERLLDRHRLHRSASGRDDRAVAPCTAANLAAGAPATCRRGLVAGGTYRSLARASTLRSGSRKNAIHTSRFSSLAITCGSRIVSTFRSVSVANAL